MAGASLLVSSCGSSNTNNQPVPADVYIAGQGSGGATYWLNGTAVPLPAGNASAGSANAIAVSGSDVYVGGSVLSGQNLDYPAYWTNGTLTQLPTNSGGQINGIAVSGSDLYAAGQNNGLAVLWKNGTPTTLTDGTNPISSAPSTTNAVSMFISGSDIYVAGTVEKYLLVSPNTYWVGLVAVYWKNGVPVELTQLANNGPSAAAMSIFISGSDVYVAGYTSNGPSNAIAVYWKNGTQVTLGSSGSPDVSTANSIVVSGSDVYVSGSLGNTYNGYWLNGTSTSLVSATSFNPMNAIAVNGTDVYAAGSTSTGSDPATTANYWKNGTVVSLSGGVVANAIVVVPQPQQ